MNVLSVLGSPRKAGNTARVLGWVEEELQARGHGVERVNIVDYKVQGCVECNKCHKSLDKPGCALKDDAPEIFERMMNANALLYASPLFCWGYSAQFKAFVDRHICLVKGFHSQAREWTSFIEGKRAGLLVSCAGPEEGNADLVVKMFKRLTHFSKTTMVGALVVPYATTPDAMGEAVRERAAQFASTIIPI